ncbi:MAG: cadherin-like domain-containing protein [Candidatus Peribacteria bacterium]|nr:MAG: cadherin-like domain-containing protein [Candidatus Peribacteria bacterium]
MVPTADANGTSTITVTLSDGSLTDIDTFVQTVVAVNDAPVISDIANQSTNEDTTESNVAFTISDTETSVACNATYVTATSSNTSLISNGNITIGGTAPNCTITVVPTANANGTSTITVTLSDGSLTDVDTFVQTVVSVNDAPSGADKTVTTNEDTQYTFTTADFGFTDPNDSPANTLNRVRISTLETAGSLELNGAGVTVGQLITPANITSGLLKFVPATNAYGTSYATFTFQVRDSGGTANGGINLDPTPNTMTINVTAVNDAPVAVDDTGSMDANTGLVIDVVANDTDVEDGTFSDIYTLIQPGTGTAVDNNDGTVTYTPPTNVG